MTDTADATAPWAQPDWQAEVHAWIHAELERLIPAVGLLNRALTWNLLTLDLVICSKPQSGFDSCSY